MLDSKVVESILELVRTGNDEDLDKAIEIASDNWMFICVEGNVVTLDDEVFCI